MKRLSKYLFLGLTFIALACKPSVKIEDQSYSSVPAWAEEAIWYQIFPERFYNGDSTNDPQRETVAKAYPGFAPEGWTTTKWTSEWHQLDPWMAGLDTALDLSGNPMTSFGQKVQLRRYGGDLAGVLAKLDYLDSLGVTAIYFNPLNDAPSLHKYDAAHWRHIDRNFGPNPKLDEKLMAQEVPSDPSSWGYTSADSLFLDLIKEVHNRGMKLIIDYSFNHTGLQFWAWQDVLERQEQSEYQDWYWTNAWDDPATDSNEFSYTGWLGVPSLPEIKDTPYVDHRKVVRAFEGDVQSEQVKRHIYNVCARWIDPNQDGDPNDGVDGFRLDVAAEMPIGFWRQFRKDLRALNNELYLIGEVWWEEYPNKLINPKPYLKGDIFDGVMNYRWFRSVRHFIAAAPDSLSPKALEDSLKSYASSTDFAHQKAWMNMSASHDAPRLSTALFNRNAYKQGVHRGNPDYKIHKPDQATRQRQKLFLAMQFTMPGAPQIYNGDEMGMWGEDDPSNRKPLIWPEFDFAPERSYPFIDDLRYDKPLFDTALFAFYQELITLRKSNPSLSRGAIEFASDLASGLLIYHRIYQGDTLIAVANNQNRWLSVDLPPALYQMGSFKPDSIGPQSFCLFRK